MKIVTMISPVYCIISVPEGIDSVIITDTGPTHLHVSWTEVTNHNNVGLYVMFISTSDGQCQQRNILEVSGDVQVRYNGNKLR